MTAMAAKHRVPARPARAAAAPDVVCACGHKGSHYGIECWDAKGKGPRRRRRLAARNY